MLTAMRYAVSWVYREDDKSVRRTLYHNTEIPCIEAARLISNNPYSSDVEVTEVDSGKAVEWKAPGIGRVIAKLRGEG